MLSFFKNSITSVSAEDALKKIGTSGVHFIDVREEGEYSAGHARGAENMPLSMLSKESGESLKKYSEVYVICQSGGRSARATEALVSFGVNAINVTGGTTGWKADGLPMES